MRELSCAACVELCPEVALGAAGAEDRADVLAHVEQCARCAASLRTMAEIGDGLTALLPPIDPPPGFERRALAAIGAWTARQHRPQVDQQFGHQFGRQLRQRLRSRPLSVAVAAAVAAILAFGGWVVGATTSAPTSPVVTAALVSQHGPVGQVVVVPGPHPWISMSVHLGSANGTVWCRVRDSRGRLVTLGTFTLSDGHGSWASSVPSGLSLRGASVMTHYGQVLASATFAAS